MPMQLALSYFEEYCCLHQSNGAIRNAANTFSKQGRDNRFTLV